MKSLQKLLNFTNSKGEVTTLFGGRITLTQLLIIILAIIAVVVVLKLLKGVIRTVILVVCIVSALLNYGLISPSSLKDVEGQIANKGLSYYSTMAKDSDNIKVEGTSIKVKLGDTWIDVKDVDSVISGNKKLTIQVGNKTYSTDDKTVIKLLNSFR